jgi:magnesium and cobalt transporter
MQKLWKKLNVTFLRVWAILTPIMNPRLKAAEPGNMEDALKKSEPAAQPPPVPEQEDRGGDTGLFDWVKSLLPAPKGQDHHDDVLRDAIEELIEEEDRAPQSAVAVHERMLISNILQLRDLPVVDVMVPRADIVAIDINISKEDLYRLMAERPHSRLPVFRDDLDNIVGVIHMKDLVAGITGKADFGIKEIIRDALVVSPAMRVMDLLLQMRQSKVHIAFVVDEFGGIDGLITINDLIEAIVGEIDDEFDFEITPQLIERPDGSAIADARFPIKSFEEKYGNIFTEDDDHEEVDTLGGLVTWLAGHVPARGEIIKHEKSGMEFEIIDADPRRVMRLRLRGLPKKVEGEKKE